MNEKEATERFNDWFVKPLDFLRKQIGPDAGWVALMVTLPLYERWLTAKLKLTNQLASDEEKKRSIAEDLGLTDEQARTFWGMIRNGLLHQAMPKTGKTGLILHPDCSEIPVFGEYDGKPVIYIDPWKFADRVLSLYNAPELIIASESFPIASVRPLNDSQLRKYFPEQIANSDFKSLPQAPHPGPGTVTPP